MARKFDHGDRNSRYRTACERLGTDKPSCLLCDETDPHAIELHHVAGRAFDSEVVPLCLNHHARASNYQKDHPPKIPSCTSPLESIGHLLLGQSDLVLIAAEDLRDPMLAEIMMYLHLKLKEQGLLLIEMARRAPSVDFGLTL